MKALSCYNIKGGVGKTSLAVNLAVALRHPPNQRVLLIDLDPQCAASYILRVAPAPKIRLKHWQKMVEYMRSNIRSSVIPRLDVLPSTLSYRKLEASFQSMEKPRTRLRDLLVEIASGYSFVVLDCPAGINLVAENIFRASDAILIPVIPSPLSVRTLTQLQEFFRKKDLPRNRIFPFASMVQRSNRLHHETLQQLTTIHPQFLRSSIPLSIHVERMAQNRSPLLVEYPRFKITQAYNDLTAELIHRIGIHLTGEAAPK